MSRFTPSSITVPSVCGTYRRYGDSTGTVMTNAVRKNGVFDTPLAGMSMSPALVEPVLINGLNVCRAVIQY